MTQATLDALDDLGDHIRALVLSEHITDEEKGELRRIRDRLDARVHAIREGEARRPQRSVPDDEHEDTSHAGQEGSTREHHDR